MAQNPLKNKDEFIKIKGINESKFKQWGEVFLKFIKDALVNTESSVETTIDVKENSAESDQRDIF